MLEAIAGPDPLDPSAEDRPFRYEAEDRPAGGFRFGVLRAAADVAATPTCGRASRRPLDVLRAIGTVEDVALPALPYEAITRTILFAEASSAFEGLVESGALAELTAPEDRYALYARDAILAKDYIKALRLRVVVAREVDRILAGLDALVAPGRFTVASRLDEPFRSAFGGTVLDPTGAIGNAAGSPRWRSPTASAARAADEPPVRGARLGREHDPRRGASVPGPDRLAPPPPGTRVTPTVRRAPTCRPHAPVGA